MPTFREVEVRTFRQHAHCDECSGGELHPSGSMLLTDPPQYPHRCDSCRVSVNLPARYPQFVTRPKD